MVLVTGTVNVRLKVTPASVLAIQFMVIQDQAAKKVGAQKDVPTMAYVTKMTRVNVTLVSWAKIVLKLDAQKDFATNKVQPHPAQNSIALPIHQTMLRVVVKVHAARQNKNVFVKKDFGVKVVKIHCARRLAKMANAAN